MQVIGMKIKIEGKVYGLERGQGADVTVIFPDGTSTLHRGIECRQDCYSLALRIARDGYGVRPGGTQPNCTNSMVHDVTDAVERVAGC